MLTVEYKRETIDPEWRARRKEWCGCGVAREIECQYVSPFA